MSLIGGRVWWCDHVSGPRVCRAGVETGLADCSGSIPFPIPPGGLCYPSPMSLIAPQGRLYPWIVIHSCTTALSSPKAGRAAFGGQAQAAVGGGGKRQWSWRSLLWAQQELNWCQAVWIDHWLPQTAHSQTPLHAPQLLTISCSPLQPLSK